MALCRVHPHGIADGIAIGKIGFGIHTLSVQVHGKVVVEERGVEVESSSNTLEI